jgi:hypothetical protein
MFGAVPFGSAPFGALASHAYEIPASETPAGKRRLRAYYAALGNFADTFSRVEAAIAYSLWHYAGTNRNIASAVFSGVRVKEAMSFIRRIAEVTNLRADLRADLENIFTQLGHITDARNDILHYGATNIAEHRGGRGSVTNALKALTEEKTKSFPISPNILNDMTADLQEIMFHLRTNHTGSPFSPRGALVLAMMDGVLHSPWRYKHPEPQKAQKAGAGKSRRSRKRDPKPLRQRPPSRA